MSSRRRTMSIAVVLALAATTFTGAANAVTTDPPLRMVAAAGSVTLESWPGEGVYLDLPVHLVAGPNPLEIWAKRTAYSQPIAASKAEWRNGKKRLVPLPAGVVTDFAGLPGFMHVTLTDSGGNVVYDQEKTFCPNGEPVRTRPDAPDKSPYPFGCAADNPFTLGAVWGLQAGWAEKVLGPWWHNDPIDLPDGTYTAGIRVNEPYLELLGIPADQSAATVAVTVRQADSPKRSTKQGRGDTHLRPAPSQPSRPTGEPGVPKGGPRPDLRSLPAWQVQLLEDDDSVEGDFLSFNATVWAAGSSPLVVDGFRRSGEDVMDAYQYFFDSAGNQTGYAEVGTMEWDARDGHHHWHFTDFAQYRLLDEDKQLAVRSGKEAFCLANTDAVDYTLPKANWRPGNTDLHTACGDYASLAVREVLDVGSGDTYAQYLPGQSFDVTGLPNGTYYIEVAANPDRRLYEQDLTNNVSHRRVILGGEPGARTVTVPPHEGVDG